MAEKQSDRPTVSESQRTLVERLDGFAAELESNTGSAITAYSGDGPLVRAAAARIRELEEALRPFAESGVTKALERDDYTIIRERIKDWLRASDFLRASKLLAHTESEDRNG